MAMFQNVFGDRSLISWFFGDFFKNAKNTSGLLAFTVVASAVYLFIRTGTAPDRLLDVVFLVVGFYFGGATAKSDEGAPKAK